MRENDVYSVWFAEKKGIAPLFKKELLLNYGSAGKLYFMSDEEINELNVDVKCKMALKTRELSYAKKIVLDCEEKGIDIIAFNDDFYPPLLREIQNPPMVLYKKGRDIDYRSVPMAGVVGSRILSEYGKYVTEKIASELSQNRFLIVSGMALGADCEAHKAAISLGCGTVAVLGCGVDIVYPYENIDIYNYMINNGAVISEYPPGTKPTKYSFPQRNRIISGMTHLTVVTEARLDSGSIITAKNAYQQGKMVYAVPQNINSPFGQGSNEILKDFAKVITSGSDAWDYYTRTYKRGDYTEELRIAVEGRSYEKEPAYNEAMYENMPALLNDEEKNIINVLKNGVTHINKIALDTGYPIGKATAVLSLLEIRGLVYSVSGNAYGLTDPKVWNKGESRI